MAYPIKGQDFDRFTLLDLISESSSTTTWLAFDGSSNERICLKLYKEASSEKQVSDTIAFISKSKGLNHQNILRVFDVGIVEKIPYLSQQFLRNAKPVPLNNRSLSENLALISEIIDALSFAHSLGLVHGKLSPSKLLYDEKGHLWVSEFGVRLGKINGLYSAPEAGEKATKVDDIYSLGALTYRILAGEEVTERRPDLDLVPSELRLVVKAMLEPADYERPDDLLEIKQVFVQYAEQLAETSLISSDTSFVKREEIPIASRQKTLVSNSSEKKDIPIQTVGLALLILIGLAALVFFYLPSNKAIIIEQPVGIIEEIFKDGDTLSDIRPTERFAPFELAQIELAKEKSIEIADQILRLQIKLEDLKVELWAKESYDSLTANALLADDAFRGNEYREALRIFEATHKSLEGLYVSIERILLEQVEIGNTALEDGNADLAVKAFRIAVALDWENDSLKSQLKRSENLKTVIEIVDSARLSEKENKLESALKYYEEAAGKDPLWKPAAAGMLRVQERLRQVDFENIMSEAFAELLQKNYAAARSAFQAATKIFPNSSEPEDGLLQIELAEKRDEIDILRLTAEQNLREEFWEEAILQFKQVLQLDNTLVFALNGLEAAKQRLDIRNRLQYFLDDPTVMKDDNQLRKAKKTISDASVFAASSAATANRIGSLSRLISLARIPTKVLIASDGKTDIFVYQVRRLGKVTSQELELYPGTYTIVGKRRGYRDVRHTLKLLANAPTNTINISCEEKI